MMRYACAVLGVVCVTGVTASASAQDLAGANQEVLSLDSLLNIRVSVASKYAQYAREAPASIVVITAEDIQRFGYRTLAEALRSISGVYASYDRNYTYLGVRGFSRPTDYNNRILLLLDGHSLNDNFYDAASLGATFGLTLDFVDRIEVAQGPSSALYGSNAMFAVVNVVPKTGSMLDGVHMTGEIGSYESLAGSVAFGRTFANGADVMVGADWSKVNGQDLYFSEFDDPSTNNGMAVDLDWDRSYGVFGAVRYAGLKFSAMRTSRTKGIPTAPWEVLFNDRAAQTHDVRAFAELRLERELSADKNVVIRGYYDSYGFNGVYPYELPGGNWVENNDGKWLGGETQFRWDVSASNRFTVGSEYRHHFRAALRASDESTVSFDRDLPFTLFSWYVQDELQLLENLSFTLGFRGDHHSTAANVVSPRGAIVYHPGQSSTFKLLYGKAFRAPTRWEAHYEEEAFFKSNPTLKSERIRTWELTWDQRLADGLFGRVSVYDYRMTDLIDETIDPVDGLGQYQNLSRVRARGVEFEITARFGSGVSGFANYALQRAETADLSEVLTNSPQHLVRVGAASPLPYGLVAAANVSYDASRRTVVDTKTDSFIFANATLSAPRLFGHARLSVTIRNLFNRAYQTPGGFEHFQTGITQDGRNFRLKLDLTY